MTDIDLRDAHDRALATFGERVRGVPDDSWDSPTPCSEWSVRDLVNHNVAENLWAGELLAGRTIEEVGDRFAGDQLGDDPVGAYERAAQSARDAAAAADVLERPVHVSYGPIPGSAYLDHRYIDLLVHAWDLAAATGQDPDLPEDLAEAAYETMRDQEAQVRASGVFAEEAEAPDDATTTERLVAFLGRDSSSWGR